MANDVVVRTQASAEARIFREAKSAMQSGPGRHAWILEYEPRVPELPDPLMGWYGSGDTLSQLRMTFQTRDEAIAFARQHGITFEAEVEPPGAGPMKPKSYSDNFRFGRRENWTH